MRQLLQWQFVGLARSDRVQKQSIEKGEEEVLLSAEEVEGKVEGRECEVVSKWLVVWGCAHE
jgi:hypothetical protein